MPTPTTFFSSRVVVFTVATKVTFFFSCLSLLLLIISTITTDAFVISPEMSQYHGTWRHVSLDPAAAPSTFASVKKSSGSSSSDGSIIADDVAAAFSSSAQKSSEDRDEEERHHRYQQQQQQQEKIGQQQIDEDDNVITLDLSLSNLTSFFDIDRQRPAALLPVVMKWNEVEVSSGDQPEEQQHETDSSSRLSSNLLDRDAMKNARCSARLISTFSFSSSSSSSEEEDDNKKERAADRATPKAVEIACDGLDVIIDDATKYTLQQRERRAREAEEGEALRADRDQHAATLSFGHHHHHPHHGGRGRSGNNKKINKKKKVPQLPDEQNPDVPPFRFLNWNETAVMWPVARVSVALHDRKDILPPHQHNNIKQRFWYEGTSSACVETQRVQSWGGARTNDNDDDDDDDKTIQAQLHGSRLSVIRVIVPLDATMTAASSSLPINKVSDFIKHGTMSVRVKLVPLGSHSPVHRQLVRWLRFVDPASTRLEEEEGEPAVEDDNDDDQTTKEDQPSFYSLRATEKRLTRLGVGFRARLRRLGGQNNAKKNEQQQQQQQHHQLIRSSNWSVEVFRRLPRPRTECAAIFSRLLSVPSLFSSSSKKKDATTSKTVDEAQLQLVSSHQLRGVLDNHFLLPEFVRMTPSTAVPCSSSSSTASHQQKQIRRQRDNDNNDELCNRPPRAMYVLYISEERFREQTVDVDVEHADFSFVAPLKVERRLLNRTYKGEYERKPLPMPPFANWTWFDATNVSLAVVQPVAQHKKVNPVLTAQAQKRHEASASSSSSSSSLSHQQQQQKNKKGGSASSSSSSQDFTTSTLSRNEEARAALPKLLFHYHNHSQFPGFSIVVEQTRPIDDLQVWVRDGKNDTLFLDEEAHVPFTVKQHAHDPIDSPLFGWRLALDSQRSFALDRLYVTMSFRFRRGDEKEPLTRDNILAALSQWDQGKEASSHLLSWAEQHRWVPLSATTRAKTRFATPSSALPTFSNYIEVQRRPFVSSSSSSASASPPVAASDDGVVPLSDTLSLEVDSNTGLWRLMTRRDINVVVSPPDNNNNNNNNNNKNDNDIFTLPWSALLRHTQAPSWMVQLVDCPSFERLLRKHNQYLLASDHVDLIREEGDDFDDAHHHHEEEVDDDDDDLLDDDDDDDDSNKDDEKNIKQKSQKKKKTTAKQSNNNKHQQNKEKPSSSPQTTRIKKLLQQRQTKMHDTVKAWTILTLMHWAQIEPSLVSTDDVLPAAASPPQQQTQNGDDDDQDEQEGKRPNNHHADWHTNTVPIRWHSHYRMFNERLKSDAARSLRRFVLSRLGQKETMPAGTGGGGGGGFSGVPSSAWSPLSESIKRRVGFLGDVHDYMIGRHPGLPRRFAGGSMDSGDWFASAYTVIEARSFLVSLGGGGDSKAEWVYVPLLDLTTPGSQEEANIDVNFVQSAIATSLFPRHQESSSQQRNSRKRNRKNDNNNNNNNNNGGVVAALQVTAAGNTQKNMIPAGTPLIFGGWCAGGMRTVTHALELFGYVLPSQKSGFVDTASLLLPFGPALTRHGSATTRRSVLAECQTRCSRVAEGRTVSVNDYDGVTTTKKKSNDDDDNTTKNEKQGGVSSSSCCSLSWLDSLLRRRWRQVVANELYWNVQPRSVLNTLLLNAGKFSLRPSDTQQRAAGTASAPEPPMWRVSRQQLLTGTLSVLEKHISEVAAEMATMKENSNQHSQQQQQNLTSLPLGERVKLAFSREGETAEEVAQRTVEDYLEDDDTTSQRHDAEWFGCCQKLSSHEEGDMDL